MLVATDVAARGLDVKDLDAVVNFDLPRSPVDFTHRTGRVGRAGRAGVAVTFVHAEVARHWDVIIKKNGLGSDVKKGVVAKGFEIDEAEWTKVIEEAKLRGGDLNGGIKGRKKSKKDKLREQNARKEKEAGS